MEDNSGNFLGKLFVVVMMASVVLVVAGLTVGFFPEIMKLLGY